MGIAGKWREWLRLSSRPGELAEEQASCRRHCCCYCWYCSVAAAAVFVVVDVVVFVSDATFGADAVVIVVVSIVAYFCRLRCCCCCCRGRCCCCRCCRCFQVQNRCAMSISAHNSSPLPVCCRLLVENIGTTLFCSKHEAMNARIEFYSKQKINFERMERKKKRTQERRRRLSEYFHVHADVDCPGHRRDGFFFGRLMQARLEEEGSKKTEELETEEQEEKQLLASR